jgi:hypothetical protein
LLTIEISARITCSAQTHASGTARLWLNDASANSRFGATIDESSTSFFLRDGSTLATSPGAGPKKTVDLPLNSKASCGGRPFVPFGAWTTTLP